MKHFAPSTKDLGILDRAAVGVKWAKMSANGLINLVGSKLLGMYHTVLNNRIQQNIKSLELREENHHATILRTHTDYWNYAI